MRIGFYPIMGENEFSKFQIGLCVVVTGCDEHTPETAPIVAEPGANFEYRGHLGFFVPTQIRLLELCPELVKTLSSTRLRSLVGLLFVQACPCDVHSLGRDLWMR